MRVQYRHAIKRVRSEGMTESFAELFEQSLANQRIRPGMILTGLIVDVTDDVVIVNVGLKSEAVIPLEQFKNERGEVEVKAGDEVEVALDSVEDGTGETRLSREKAKRARTWTRLEKAFNKSEIVTGIITGRVKGGFTVEIDNVRAFLPGSLVDVRPVRDTVLPRGQAARVQGHQARPEAQQRRGVAPRGRRAGVLRRARARCMDNLQEGAVVKGVGQEPHRLRCVRRPRRHRWPAAHHRHGVEARQASVRSRQGRRRDRRAHPQVRPRALARLAGPEAARRGSVGEHCAPLPAEHARVRQGHQHRRLRRVRRDRGRRRGPGARLRNGLDQQERQSGQGRAHRPGSRGHGARRRRGASPHLARPQAVQGQSVEGVRRELQPRRQGRRGQIKSITDFGIFIGLPGNIDGLVHLSDISWDMPGEEAVRNYQKGQQLEAMVLSIDPERERISLGIKQLAKDPFSAYIAEQPEGQHRQGRRSRKSTRAARSSISATASKASCAPPSSAATASRMRARCSRSARRSKRSSPASIARRARSRCRSRPRKCTRKREAVQSYRSEAADRRARAWATCSRSRSARERD